MIYSLAELTRLIEPIIDSRFDLDVAVEAVVEIIRQDREAHYKEILKIMKRKGERVPHYDGSILRLETGTQKTQNELLDELRDKVGKLYGAEE